MKYNLIMPLAGARASILPWILIGVAVLLVVGLIIVNIVNKNK